MLRRDVDFEHFRLQINAVVEVNPVGAFVDSAEPLNRRITEGVRVGEIGEDFIAERFAGQREIVQRGRIPTEIEIDAPSCHGFVVYGNIHEG